MSAPPSLLPFVRRGRSESLWRMFVFVVLAFSPFVGGILLYSDATGQRPIHNEAVAGLFLLWVGWMGVCTCVILMVDWLVVGETEE